MRDDKRKKNRINLVKSKAEMQPCRICSSCTPSQINRLMHVGLKGQIITVLHVHEFFEVTVD